MTVANYTVSDSKGNISDVGKIIKASDPFKFYVQNTSAPALEVQIVMPLGGTESGLFRYPRVGEKVLVGTEGEGGTAARYLMGYIPSYTAAIGSNQPTQDFQTANMFEDDGRGEVFRYQQTGKTDPKEEKYSEIGFYHKKTAWKAANKASYADIPNDYPLIDQINIHSTGDIHESAANHHQIQAKRLELLADEKKPDPVDPAKFKGGDIHIKAGEDITIEAGGSITLKVGRGSITISDSGVTFKHQLMRKVPNLADASISLSAREGIFMAGETVGISADYEWSISEKLGSSIGGTAGALALSAREINATTPEWVPQQGAQIAYALNYAQKIIQGGLALNKNSKVDVTLGNLITKTIITFGKAASDITFFCFKLGALSKKFDNFNKVPTTLRLQKKLADEQSYQDDMTQHLEDYEALVYEFDVNESINRVLAINKQLNDLGNTGTLDPALKFLDGTYNPPYQRVALAMELTLNLVKEVFNTVEMFLEPEGDALDNFNFASLVVTNTLILGFTSVMLYLNRGLKDQGSAGLCLGFDGSIVAKAATEEHFYAETHKEGAATATMIPKWIWRATAAATGAVKLTDWSDKLAKLCMGFDEWKEPKIEEAL